LPVVTDEILCRN